MLTLATALYTKPLWCLSLVSSVALLVYDDTPVGQCIVLWIYLIYGSSLVPAAVYPTKFAIGKVQIRLFRGVPMVGVKVDA